MNNLIHSIYSFVLRYCEADVCDIYTTFTLFAIFLASSTLLYWVLTRPICRLLQHIVARTETKWDDRLLQPKFIHAAALLIVMIIANTAIPDLFYYYKEGIPSATKIVRVLLISNWGFMFYRLANEIYAGLREDEIAISGLAVLRNIINTVIAVVCALLVLSVILSKNITYLLSGLGAMAAVLSLVFKDSILGMVAGVRLVANKMICHNDWIRMPSRNIDGRIKDITLTAVKVRNWDNSITTVPPHALTQEGFCNMEEMLRAGSRRIMRAINIDINSIRILNDSQLSNMDIPDYLRPLISKSINEHGDISNLSLWRRHLEESICKHPLADLEQRYMVRELAPTEYGIPVEIFFFVKCQEWERFESIQADFFDNIIAEAHIFGLKIYQLPASTLTNSAQSKDTLKPITSHNP